MSIPTAEERPTLSVPEAGAFLGLGRSQSYEAARVGTLPTIRLSERREVVPTAALRRLLGLDVAESVEATGNGPPGRRKPGTDSSRATRPTQAQPHHQRGVGK